MNNVYAPQPVDRGLNVLVGYPMPEKAEAQYVNNNIAVSSVITVDADTTTIEVTASGATALLRWVPSTETAAVSPFASVSATNFDHAIAANQTRRFALPPERQGVPSVVGYNAQAGLYSRYAIISNGIGSVITSEFR